MPNKSKAMQKPYVAHNRNPNGSLKRKSSLQLLIRIATDVSGEPDAQLTASYGIGRKAEQNLSCDMQNFRKNSETSGANLREIVQRNKRWFWLRFRKGSRRFEVHIDIAKGRFQRPRVVSMWMPPEHLC